MTTVKRNKSTNGIKYINHAGLIGSRVTYRVAEDHIDALAIGPAKHAGCERSRQRTAWGAMTRDRDA
ncbi:unannotated protein [freshwater metagenome]|uniref:Unannotated protein n=1 Tax=freshwater metagenome TaxID=449393 RepID=A0A6J7IE38_9ZZZZ